MSDLAVDKLAVIQRVAELAEESRKYKSDTRVRAGQLEKQCLSILLEFHTGKQRDEKLDQLLEQNRCLAELLAVSTETKTSRRSTAPQPPRIEPRESDERLC